MTQVADLVYPPDARNNKLGGVFENRERRQGRAINGSGNMARLRKQIIS
jgi:hypothetical protein